MSRVLLWAETTTGEILDAQGKPSGLSVQKLHGTTDVWVNGVWVRTAMLSAARPDIAALEAQLAEARKYATTLAMSMHKQHSLEEAVARAVITVKGGA